MHTIQGWDTDTGESKCFRNGINYIGEHFNDEREQPAIHKNIEQPEILICEVESIPGKLKRNKIAELDKICIETLTALDNFSIEIIPEIVKEKSIRVVI